MTDQLARLGGENAVLTVERRGLDALLWWSLAAYSGVTVAASSASHLSIGSLAKIIGVQFILVTMLAYRRRVRTGANWVLVGLFVLTGLAIGSYFWSMVPSATLSRAPTYVLLLTACVAVVMSLRTLGAQGVRAIAVGLMIGGVIAAALVLVAAHNHTFVSPNQYAALEERVTAGAADPNDVALCMTLTMPIFIVDKRWLVKLLALPVGTAVLLTGSRGGLIALAAGLFAVVVVPLFNNRAKRIRQSTIGSHPWQTLIVAVISVVVGYQFLPAAITQRLATIPAQLSGGTLTNRTILWQGAWQGFLHHSLFGIGIGSTPTYELGQTGYFLVAHNINLSILLELGLAGWTCFVVALVSGFHGGVQFRADVPWLLPSLIALLVGSYALSWEYNKMVWLLLTLGGFLASIPRDVSTQSIFGLKPADQQAIRLR